MHGSEIQAKYGSSAWKICTFGYPKNITHPGNMEILEAQLRTFFSIGCEPSHFQSTDPSRGFACRAGHVETTGAADGRRRRRRCRRRRRPPEPQSGWRHSILRRPIRLPHVHVRVAQRQEEEGEAQRYRAVPPQACAGGARHSDRRACSSTSSGRNSSSTAASTNSPSPPPSHIGL